MLRITNVRTQTVHRLITLRFKALGRRSLGTSMTGTAWQRLSDLDACRITRIPRHPQDAGADQARPADRDTGRPQRAAALASARQGLEALVAHALELMLLARRCAAGHGAPLLRSGVVAHAHSLAIPPACVCAPPGQ